MAGFLETQSRVIKRIIKYFLLLGFKHSYVLSLLPHLIDTIHLRNNVGKHHYQVLNMPYYLRT